MNWLGALIAKRCRSTDHVLDIGCGIMQPTGRLPVKKHVGLDSFKPYLDRIGPPTICGNLPGALEGIQRFDLVLLLDIVEHLSKSDAVRTIELAERISRREVIIFTPDGFVSQPGYSAWDMGVNPKQKHLCGFTIHELEAMGYSCERYSNCEGNEVISILGIKCV